MTSGVRRQRVRSRFRWRTISCPAAKQMRWVKPSMATESPFRTRSATASRIDVTLLAGMGVGSARCHLGARLLEEAQSGLGLVLPKHQGRSDPDGLVARRQYQ